MAHSCTKLLTKSPKMSVVNPTSPGRQGLVYAWFVSVAHEVTPGHLHQCYLVEILQVAAIAQPSLRACGRSPALRMVRRKLALTMKWLQPAPRRFCDLDEAMRTPFRARCVSRESELGLS